jgi:ATP-binding cassette subfamily B (MDR/TAP) protein 1
MGAETNTAAKEQKEDLQDKKKKEADPKVSLLDLFRFANGWDKLVILIGLISAAASGFGWPALALVFGELLDTFLSFDVSTVSTNGTTNSSAKMPCNFPSNSNMSYSGNFHEDIKTASIRFAITGAGVWLATYLYVTLLIWTAERQTRRMREEFFHSIMRQEIGWFDTSDPGELATRMTEDLNKVYGGIGDKLGALVQWTTSFFGGLVVGLIVDWRLALVMIGVTPIMGTIAGLAAKVGCFVL